MSKIATYQLADTPLELSDRLIGTEAIRPNPTPTPLATKNFSLGELLNLFASNFPSDSLQQVLDTGNAATQNMTLNGTIVTTLIKPTNIEDISGSQGLPSEYLRKGTTGISWVPIPVDTLQDVLNAGNTATQNMILIGNITSTLIIPGNIKDELGNNGVAGQVLTKTATGIRWQGGSVPTLANVLSVGNSASTPIIIETSQYESKIEYDRISVRDKSNNAGVSLDRFGAITFTNSVNSAQITSSNVTNPNVEFKLPNKPTGTYTLATISDLSAAIWGNITGTITDQTDLINYLSTNYYPTSNPNGYISQESVLEYADISAFPIVGASNTIYIALDTGIGYFWDGTAYSVLSTSTSGISGFGIVNRLAKFSPNGSSIASSKITESLFGDVKLNDSNRPYIAGNTILSIQRAQAQLDFVLGNPLTSQISRMISDNNVGLSIESKNYLSFATGPSYTESFRLLSSGKLQITQTPNAGTTSDSILVRDSLGEVKTISYPTLTGFVPYTGATSNVDLGEWQLKAGEVEFDQTPTGTSGVAKLRWNDTDGTLDLGLKGGNVTLQIGQEEVIRVVNKSGINLLESNYQVTRIRNVAEGGAQGQRLAIVLAQANTKVNHTGVLGLVTENIDNNQEGFITTFGMVRDINTTGSIQGETWVDGDVLWLSETVAGRLTNIEPNTHPVQIGYVVYAHANNGKIFVSVSGGADELNELHDVTISSPVNNNILSYNSSLQRWENKTISEIDGLSLQSGVSNLEYIFNLIHKQNLGWMQPNNGNATYSFLKSSTSTNLSGGSGTNAIPARLVYETAATAGGVCFARGLSGGAFSAASTVSFWWSRKFEITSNVANSRFVCALSNQFRLSNPTNVEPTTLINLIGVCKLSTSDNLHFIWNDATGTASTLDLGTNFPANNTTAYTYIFEIYKIFDSTDIVLKLSRIDVNGNVLTTQHTINSDTPALIMSAVIFGTNNTTASVFSFNDFGTVFKNYERQWDTI